MNIRLLFRQFIQYVLVGGLAFVVDFAALYFLADQAGLHYLVAASLAFLLGLTTNYILCIVWVFEHRSINNKRYEFFIFGVIGLFGLVLTNLLMFVLTDLLNFHYLVSKAGATIIILFLNFFLRRSILFSDSGAMPERQEDRGATNGVRLSNSWQRVAIAVANFWPDTSLRVMEKIAATGTIFAFLLACYFSLDFYFPNISSGSFVAHHYLGPLVPAVVGIGLLKAMTRRNYTETIPVLDLFRDMLAFIVVTWIHFNLKLWSQLINPVRYDDAYQLMDERFRPILDALQEISNGLNQLIPASINAYHDVFVAMFVISFFAHALQAKPEILQKLLASTALILLIGGGSYSIAPAMGPFYYGDWGMHGARGAQEHMINFYTMFLDSRGDIYAPSYFVAAVAAMPSLHIAHSLMFTYFALRYLPKLGFFYLLLLCFIGIEAVALRWHYAIDLVAGCAVAVLCILVAEKINYKVETSTCKMVPQRKLQNGNPERAF